MNGRAPDREAVIRTLQAHEAELRAQGVSHVYLFGSVARGDQTAQSDIDIFFDKGAEFSLLDLVSVKRTFRELLSHRVDAMTRNSVHPYIRERVQAEAVQAF